MTQQTTQFSIAEIYRYPVKSMGGHTLQQAQLQEQGIPGDRCWTLVDEQRGGIKGGKRFPQLMSMQAALKAEPGAQTPSPAVEITLPDGSTVSNTDPDINARLSAAVDAPVSLWPLVPKEQVDHYLRQPPEPGTDQEAALREVFARTGDEPLPDLSIFPPELFTYESPPGTYFDAYSLLILTRQALATMQAATDAVIDIRRFRPNILLEAADVAAQFPENEWAGRTATIGEATLQFELACPRCIMTTHGFHEIPKQPEVMRALVSKNEGNLGMYASVIKPGAIQVGDVLQLQD